MLLLLVGCLDPISNRLFFEDQEFLDALPSAEHQRLHYAATEEDAEAVEAEDDEPDAPLVEVPEGAPALLELTVGAVNGANFIVDGFLSLVDGLRTIPPSTRTEDERVWGPYPYGEAPAFDIRVTSHRYGLGQFDWSFETAPTGTDDWTTFFAGTHDAGATVKDGLGTFTFDGPALAALGNDDDDPVYLRADYDNRFGSAVTFRVYADKASSTGTPAATYSYVIDPDLAGVFTFDTDTAEWVEGPAIEHYFVTSQWVPDVGGRGDAIVSGGDLAKWGVDSVAYTQCWLPDGTLVYQHDQYEIGPTVGTEANCTVPVYP